MDASIGTGRWLAGAGGGDNGRVGARASVRFVTAGLAGIRGGVGRDVPVAAAGCSTGSCVAVGVAVGMGSGVSVGVGSGVSVGVGVGFSVRVGVGVSVGVGSGVSVGVGVGFSVRVGVGVSVGVGSRRHAPGAEVRAALSRTGPRLLPGGARAAGGPGGG